MSDIDQQIRESAYHLWNDAGRPDGQCDAFWLRAQREVLAVSLETPAVAAAAKVVKAPKAKAKTARRKAA